MITRRLIISNIYFILSGFKLNYSATAALLVIGIIQASGYTMKDMCSQFTGAGYIGDPTDCTKWGYCSSQQLVSWGSCGDGLVYDAYTSSCEYATDRPCSTSVTKTCSVLKNPTLIADPSNCANYAYCFGNGTAQIQKCPDGQNYAANNETCVWGPDCPQDTICRFMPSPIFVGDPDNCGNFLKCIQGSGTSGACSPSGAVPRYFNVVTGKCQTANPCTSNSVTDSGTVTEPTTPDGTCADDADKGKYFSDGASCSGYFYCDGTKATWGMCPFGTQFSDNFCVSPASVACTYDRCANTNMTFATVEGTKCKEYKICASGLVASCPTDFPFFDEVNGKCVTDNPGYVICGGTGGTSTTEGTGGTEDSTGSTGSGGTKQNKQIFTFSK